MSRVVRTPRQLRRLGRQLLIADYVLVVAGFYLVIPLISVQYVDHLGWAAALVGLALALRQVTQQGLAVVGGLLGDRFGAKPLILAGLACRGLSFLLLAFADTPTELLIACLLAGLGGALFDAPRSALAMKLARPSERAGLFALLGSVEGGVAAVSTLVGAWLIAVDFRWVALLGSALFAAATLLNLFWLPAWRMSRQVAPPRRALLQVLRDRPFMRFCWASTGYFALRTQLLFTLPLLTARVSESPLAVGWLYSLNAALTVLGTVPLTRLVRRHGSDRGQLVMGVLVMGAGLGVLGLAVGPLARVALWGPVMLWLAIGIFLLGCLLALPAHEAVTAELAAPQARGAYLGVRALAIALGAGSGQLLGGSLLDLGARLGAPGAVWLVFAAIGAAAAWAFTAGHRPAAIAAPLTA